MTVCVGGVGWGLSGVLTVIKLYLWTHRTINPSDSLCGWCGVGVRWGGGGVLTVIKLYLWNHRTITPVIVYMGGVGWGWGAVGWCGVLTVIKLYLLTHRTITPVTVYVGGVGVGWGVNCYKVIFVDVSNDNPSDSLCGWCGGGGAVVC